MRQNTFTTFTRFSLSVLAAGCLASGLNGAEIAIDQTPPVREGAHAGYAPIVDKVAPSVVSITSTKKAKQMGLPSGRFLDPRTGRLLDPRMFPGFGGGQMQPDQKGSGSGVVLTENGYIVTNHHVIEGADQVQVALEGDEALYDAEVVGTDPSTDLAVLKIDKNGLTAAKIGASSGMKPGDFVLAVGNPFNLPNTVTQGIISATGRTTLGITGRGGYEDFIQTDASINPGNSGGALIDNRGRVIGINTAIHSSSGGNQGIGFAIPSDLAVDVVQQLIDHGEVKRGFLGIQMADMTPELGKGMNFDGDGVLIQDVVSGSPAAEAGLRAGDVIIKYGDTTVEDMLRFRLMVGSTRPGEEMTIVVDRKGKEKVLKVTIGSPGGDRVAMRSGSGWGSQESGELLDGLQVSRLDEQTRERLGIPEDITGLIVEGVEKGSPADRAGLQKGEIISEIDREPVTDLKTAIELKRRSLKGGDDVLLLRVLSRGGSRFIPVQVD